MSNSKYMVLIADDNKDWCKDLQAEIEGLQVFGVLQPAYNGNDAIESIKLHRPDIIILDLILPFYDGLYIINFIHNDMDQYHPFIYVLSAIGTEKTNNIMQNLNADYYSVKPITADAVATNILNIYRKRKGPKTADGKPGAANKRTEPHRKVIDIDKFIDTYLYDLGVPLYRLSSKCLRLALKLALEDDTILTNQKELYQKVCDQMPKPSNASSVERNLRTAIKTIYDASNPYYLQCFPEARKKLSNSEFLNKSVYLLRKQIEDYLSD